MHIKRGSKILDVGCGGGRPVLNLLGTVTGLEPIKSLAEQAKGLYPEVCIAFAEAMPFAENTFDAVVSTDILGHIPFEIKDPVLAEIYRVLKPGGITLHIAEVESNGWLAEYGRREPALYRQHWVLAPDHVAMEPAKNLIARFKKAGFQIEIQRPLDPLIPTVGAISTLLKDYPKLPWWLRLLRFMDGGLHANEYVTELANILLTPLFILNWHKPVENATGIMIKARKV